MIDQNKINRVIGFFAAKGLLVAPGNPLYPSIKLHLADVFEVAYYEEPRVLEVLPAGLLAFPRSFLGRDKLPKDFLEILNKIRRGDKDGPSYRGILYKNMKRWAELKLKDRRTKPLKEKKILKSYRLSPKTVASLKKLSKKFSKTETGVIEDLVRAAGDF